MAFAISTPTTSFFHSSSTSSSSCKASSLYFYSTSNHKNGVFYHFKGIPQLGFAPFAQWNGLKHWGLSISQYSLKIERRGKCKGKGVYASLFGVGAPEALVIGVVALLVFGPKGLAEVARNLGKTLRAFQPTIKELQEVSREFKSTLEREIGLDDIDTPVPRSSNPPKPTPETPVEDPKTDVEPESGVKVTEAQLKGALARIQQEQEEERAREEAEKAEKEKLENQSESSTPSQDTAQASNDTAQEASSVAPLSQDSPQASADNTPQEAASVSSPAQNPESSYTLQEAASSETS